MLISEQNSTYVQNKWITTSEAVLSAVLGCNDIMLQKLTFDICHLNSSLQYNKHIIDLYERDFDNISQNLSYASYNWINFLVECAKLKQHHHILHNLLDTIFHKYFFKLIFKQLANFYYAKKLCDTSLLEDVIDTIIFVRETTQIMPESTPHMYDSAPPQMTNNHSLYCIREDLPNFILLDHFDTAQDILFLQKFSYTK